MKKKKKTKGKAKNSGGWVIDWCESPSSSGSTTSVLISLTIPKRAKRIMLTRVKAVARKKW